MVRDGKGGRAVATIVDGHLYAIAVDALEDVSSFAISTAPIGHGAASEWDFVTGVADGIGETLMAVDVDRLVERASALA
jgi:purine-binding chemotaxis protein CheW